MFSQDTTIFVKSRGIKYDHALFFFKYEVNILVFYLYSQFATIFSLCMFFVMHSMQSWQIKNKAKSIFFSTYVLCDALCKLSKSETEIKLAFFGQAN
jgi:hypothetical protein